MEIPLIQCMSYAVCLPELVGMSHEVANLIQENTELLATKLVDMCVILA